MFVNIQIVAKISQKLLPKCLIKSQHISYFLLRLISETFLWHVGHENTIHWYNLCLFIFHLNLFRNSNSLTCMRTNIVRRRTSFQLNDTNREYIFSVIALKLPANLVVICKVIPITSNWCLVNEYAWISIS